MKDPGWLVERLSHSKTDVDLFPHVPAFFPALLFQFLLWLAPSASPHAAFLPAWIDVTTLHSTVTQNMTTIHDEPVPKVLVMPEGALRVERPTVAQARSSLVQKAKIKRLAQFLFSIS